MEEAGSGLEDPYTMNTASSNGDFFENLDDELNQINGSGPADARENTASTKPNTKASVSSEETIVLSASAPERGEVDKAPPETHNEAADAAPIDVKQFM